MSPGNIDSSRFPVSRNWAAKWVWNSTAPERNAWVLFRSEFDAKEAEGVRLFISADTRYRTWINGELIGDGPVQSQPYHQYYDERDISGYVAKGTNCVAVVVNHQGIQDSTRGGLIAEVVDAEGTPLSASGPDWRTSAGGAWRSNTTMNGMNKIGPFPEHVDLRALPAGWQKKGFDDGGWDQPLVLGAPPVTMPWCRMVPRDIEFLVCSDTYAESIQMSEECLDLATRRCTGDLSISLSQAGRPLDWARIDGLQNLCSAEGETLFACSDRHLDGVTDGRYDPCVTLDFGRVITGYAELEVDAPAGAIVEIGYAERLVDGRFNNAIECPFADKVTCDGGVNRFRPLVWRSFRYLRLRVKECDAGLKVKAARAVEIKYPYEDRGAYHGTERLEKIFGICRRTVELCSIESLMDTPFREQAQWLGDVAAVTVPCIYACFGDTALPRKFLKQAAMNTKPTGLLANLSNVSGRAWQHDIPDYSLWWVIALWQHYLYTGDESMVHDCYPEMQRVMRPHLERINEDGILDQMFGWVFIDWAHIDKKGACAPYNAIFAGACDAAASLAAVKKDSWFQGIYADAAKGIRKAFAGTFINPDRGVVVDAVDNGKLSDLCSEQGNAAAIAFDCLDSETADSIIEAVFDECTVEATESQPFFMVVVLEALRRRGRVDLALKLIDDRWGKRMVDRGRTSCTEEWYENGSWRNGDWSGFERTHSHAWSACAAEFLIKGLAGVEILEAGCGKLGVNPYKAEFPYDVVYPTPHGDVHVKWDGKETTVVAPDAVEIVS